MEKQSEIQNKIKEMNLSSNLHKNIHILNHDLVGFLNAVIDNSDLILQNYDDIELNKKILNEFIRQGIQNLSNLKELIKQQGEQNEL